MGNTPTAIVIRFDAKDNTEAHLIMGALQEVLSAMKAEAWMCNGLTLDALNKALTKLGWPADG